MGAKSQQVSAESEDQQIDVSKPYQSDNYQKKESCSWLGHDQITVANAFRMPGTDKILHELAKKQLLADKNKKETKRAVKEHKMFYNYVKDFEKVDPKKPDIAEINSFLQSPIYSPRRPSAPGYNVPYLITDTGSEMSRPKQHQITSTNLLEMVNQ